jgi:K+-sensing histidine kinase KdpD
MHRSPARRGVPAGARGVKEQSIASTLDRRAREAVLDDDSERLFYTALGPLAAVALGMLLTSVRGFTTASNFAYIFLVLTIVVAEFGGRRAAVATALASALSLDFFLTQPYLTLEIADKHDLIAFVGLAVCGLVAAGLGAKRGERRADLRELRRHRDLLRAALVELDAREALEYRVKSLLDACRSVLPLSAMVLRDNNNQVVAASPIAKAVPETVLRQDDLLPIDVSDSDQHPRDLPLSPEGARLALMVAGRQVGWLDMWGAKAPASAEGRRTLADVGRVLAAMLARPRESTPGVRDTIPDP